jgi:hypothetical protein
MISILTTASPADLKTMAGVAWRKPTPETLVTWGKWQGTEIGIEPVGKLWVVHFEDDRAVKEILSFLEDRALFGVEAWKAAGKGESFPCIGGSPIATLIDGSAGVKIEKDGKETKLDTSTAAAAIDALGAAQVDP